MQTFRAAFLFTELLYAAWLPLGYLDSSTDESETFRIEDYSHWLDDHEINLVNYVAKVGSQSLILSPITPAPITIRWFSLSLDGELPPSQDANISTATLRYFEKFKETYNTSWRNVYKYDAVIRWLRILNVRLGYADVFRVLVEDGRKAASQHDPQTIDVAVTLMIFERHECGFAEKPKNTKNGDSLILHCSVIVNGFWNASLIFRNDYDESEIIGELSECDSQPSIGSKICSTVHVIAEAKILAYSCRLIFPSSARHHPKASLFQHSTWTATFNEDIVCAFPKINLEAMPSEVTFLCNQMSCGNTALVDDTVTCLADGYPQPVFDIRIQKLSSIPTSEDDDEGSIFLDTSDESSEVEIKGFEDYKIKQKDVGHVNLTCTVSNKLGWRSNSLVLEIKEGDVEPRKGIFVLCNGRICKDFEVMRIEDEISCSYDARIYERELSLTLKLMNVVKAVQEPWLYALQYEDVGEKLVQCLGSTGAGIYVSEASISIIHDYRHHSARGDIRHPTIVILCQEHECQDNETVDMFEDITCTTKSHVNEVIEMQLNGITVGVAKNNYTHKIVEAPANGTLLFVVCNTSSDANNAVFVELHVNVGHATIVILCQEHECQNNETVDMFQDITCIIKHLVNEVIEMQLNGVIVGAAENNYTHRIVKAPTNGTLLHVVCYTSSDINNVVSVQLHVGNVGLFAAHGELEATGYDEDFDSPEVLSHEDEKSKFREDKNYDDYFAEFERAGSATLVPNSFALLHLFVVFFGVCVTHILD